MAILTLNVHDVAMPYRPKKSKKFQMKPGELSNARSHDHQFLDQRRRDSATRSTLSRLRNRKSDLK